MLTVEHLARGDNLRPVPRERVTTAIAALRLFAGIEAGTAIERDADRRRIEDAERR